MSAFFEKRLEETVSRKSFPSNLHSISCSNQLGEEQFQNSRRYIKMTNIDHQLDVDDLVFDNTETIHSDR